MFLLRFLVFYALYTRSFNVYNLFKHELSF